MANRIEVFGDECAVEDCPYEHTGTSAYCSYHQASGENVFHCPCEQGFPEECLEHNQQSV